MIVIYDVVLKLSLNINIYVYVCMCMYVYIYQAERKISIQQLSFDSFFWKKSMWLFNFIVTYLSSSSSKLPSVNYFISIFIIHHLKMLPRNNEGLHMLEKEESQKRERKWIKFSWKASNIALKTNEWKVRKGGKKINNNNYLGIK